MTPLSVLGCCEHFHRDSSVSARVDDLLELKKVINRDNLQHIAAPEFAYVVRAGEGGTNEAEVVSEKIEAVVSLVGSLDSDNRDLKK